MWNTHLWVAFPCAKPSRDWRQNIDCAILHSFLHIHHRTAFKLSFGTASVRFAWETNDKYTSRFSSTIFTSLNSQEKTLQMAFKYCCCVFSASSSIEPLECYSPHPLRLEIFRCSRWHHTASLPHAPRMCYFFHLCCLVLSQLSRWHHALQPLSPSLTTYLPNCMPKQAWERCLKQDQTSPSLFLTLKHTHTHTQTHAPWNWVKHLTLSISLSHTAP